MSLRAIAIAKHPERKQSPFVTGDCFVATNAPRNDMPRARLASPTGMISLREWQARSSLMLGIEVL